MKRNLLFTIALFCTVVVSAQPARSKQVPRPKLVVGIVVDQMRWDYLYRYYDRYEEGGFKRFLNEGFTCENTNIDYAPTVTAIGHSTIYTGSVPAIHGIAGNSFIIQATGQTLYCTEDSTVETVGSTSKAGKMSPRNLLTSTIGDELKLATNFRSKVIGISLKDRGSILPAGHAANAAYWYDGGSGNWITSTFYMKALPAWVNQFNNQKLPAKYLKQDWNTLYDIKTYKQSLADDNRYEGKFDGTAAPTFPIKTSEMIGKDFRILPSTPYGNTFTLEMAKAAIENERLGQGEETDLLAVSFSSPDYIGHRFSVNSIEVEDTYLRLDKNLAELFTFLDKKLGKNQYTVFLSADHGAAHNPNFLMDNKMPAGLWPSGQIRTDLNAMLQNTFKVDNLVTSFSNSQAHLNKEAIAKNNLDEEAIIKSSISFLKKQEGVAFVVDNNKVSESSLPAFMKNRIINGYNPERSGNITIILKPAWYSGAPNATGTSHSALYGYDAHIPLLWMGWGIKKGSTDKPTHMSDIAPTLAALLKIQAPNGSIGEPIEEVFSK